MANADFVGLTDRQLANHPVIFAEAPISSVSEKYTFVPTIRVVNLLRDIGWHPTSVKTANVRHTNRQGLQKHIVRFARQDLVLNGERVELVLGNSHDTGCAFWLWLGVFRLVCTNGMVVGDTFGAFRHKHIGFDADVFIEGARRVAVNGTKVADRIEDFRTIDLTPSEQGIYAYSARQLVYGQDDIPHYDHRLLNEPRRQQDQGDDLWTTYNRVQENLTKGGIEGWSHRREEDGSIRRTRRYTTRPINDITKDTKLNQALWTLTERMAEIKGKA
jgi:hypothetical protein